MPTAADTSRRSSTGGSSAAPGLRTSESSATAWAAAAIMASLTRLARDTATPSPRPGKTSALLAWAMTYRWPSWSTGGNGLPVATRARPSVQRSRSSGSASHLEVGFDSGRMIGRSTWAAMSRTIGSENAPAWVEVPIRTVGAACATTSASPMTPLGPAQPDTSAVGHA